MQPENQPSPVHETQNRPAKSGGGSKWMDILDISAKLIATGAVVAVTVIANQFQSSMTATSLLSQREQADSALRAGMFHELVGPIVGSEKSTADIPVNRERLLVELLALNFHDHFELKPMLLHVDERLAHEKIAGMAPTQKEDARESLRSIARRILQRQLAALTKVETDTLPEQQACIYELSIEGSPQAGEANETPSPQPCSTLTKHFDELIGISSPSGKYTLTFAISSPNWEDQRFTVLMHIAESKPVNSKSQGVSADQDFTLTWFDFPFTDNTLLGDGTRFSMVLKRVDKQKVTLNLVWFPQDYFAPLERPTNHRQLREKLGWSLK